MSGYTARPLPAQPRHVSTGMPSSVAQSPAIPSGGWDPRRSYNGPAPPLPPQPSSSTTRPPYAVPPSPQIISPKPHHAPTHIPTAHLQAQASEIAAVSPYSRSSSNIDPSATSSIPPATAAVPGPDMNQNMTSLGLDYNRRQSSVPSQTQSGFLPSASVSRHSMLPPNMPQMPPRPHSANPNTNSLRQSTNSSSLGASRNGNTPSKQLARPLPTTEDLSNMRSYAQEPQSKVSWAKAVFKYLERNQSGTTIADPALVQWVDEAVRIILQYAQAMPPIPEALYIKADLTMSGTFPTILSKNPKSAVGQRSARVTPLWTAKR